MDEAGKRLRLLVAAVNLGWSLWAIAGGVYLIQSQESLGSDNVWRIFGQVMHGYNIAGWSLIVFGFVSLASVRVSSLGKVAALLCAAWCGVITVALLASETGAGADQFLYTWLLAICAFTCVMRWALLVLEPHLVK